jgi:hypothetical protein
MSSPPLKVASFQPMKIPPEASCWKTNLLKCLGANFCTVEGSKKLVLQ